MLTMLLHSTQIHNRMNAIKCSTNCTEFISFAVLFSILFQIIFLFQFVNSSSRLTANSFAFDVYFSIVFTPRHFPLIHNWKFIPNENLLQFQLKYTFLEFCSCHSLFHHYFNSYKTQFLEWKRQKINSRLSSQSAFNEEALAFFKSKMLHCKQNAKT